MTQADTQEAEDETIVFPQISGLNWPSYLLQAWRTLHALGVPEENLRLLPEIGHFAVPEISSQEPPGPAFDPFSERLTVHHVDPAAVRPRLTVSVRADVVEYFLPEEEGARSGTRATWWAGWPISCRPCWRGCRVLRRPPSHTRRWRT